MRTQKMEMEIVNLNCAGIDIGSRSHFVAVGQGENDVKEFGVYADDLTDICLHLKSHDITSVAMESTGMYWQNLYVELMKHGFDVCLCNGKFTKNIKGKKTDVKDARWIQKLHSIGLLSSSFLPDETTETLRTYCRQRQNMIALAAEASHKMQKYLKLLNFRLDVVVNDICGQTGMAIIEDICKGNLDPSTLAEHRNGNCRKSKEEIAKALKGNNRTDYLFGLKQELDSYHFYQKKIAECDKQISMSHATTLSIISEIGPEGFHKFQSAKQFASWLRLAPNNKISGGKVLSSKIPKGSNRLKIALRSAANVIGNLKDTPLSDFFRRVCYRKGRMVAISATARKLAVIIWNMVVKRQPYQSPVEYLFLDQKRKLKTALNIRKQIAKFALTNEDLGISNNLIISTVQKR
ncbi:hypothetical protein EZS27_016479 [termite gut metagenome]|uniref:Uncharacterized protein n=1 Tax=termite gut metagenome TaxID=433724 RepID=A0A5J4RNS2_9ZZZZ